jgi:hypothetical protein
MGPDAPVSKAIRWNFLKVPFDYRTTGQCFVMLLHPEGGSYISTCAAHFHSQIGPHFKFSPPHIRNYCLFPSHRLHILSLSTMIRQIQKRPLGSVAIPLFLFHDASGTVSSYYNLGPLGRDVYVIPDARMESDTFESVQDKSRRHYAAIKSLVPEGRVLLGGKRNTDTNDQDSTD